MLSLILRANPVGIPLPKDRGIAKSAFYPSLPICEMSDPFEVFKAECEDAISEIEGMYRRWMKQRDGGVPGPGDAYETSTSNILADIQETEGLLRDLEAVLKKSERNPGQLG